MALSALCGTYPRAVVFLDVDGVLHSLYGDDVFVESCCAQLERILRVTGAAIVLSSTWRQECAKVAILDEMLRRRGLAPVSDCTEVIDSVAGRAAEITRWLDLHPGTVDWVAIDDMDLEAITSPSSCRLRGRFVRTSSQTGLTESEADRAVATLACCSPGRSLTPASRWCFAELAAALGGDSKPAALLQCVHAAGMQLGATLPVRDTCLAISPPKANRTLQVGRTAQADFFARLVPDEAARNCISRVHFELEWEGLTLRLRKTSSNMLLLNGQPMADQGVVPVTRSCFLSFCIPGSACPFLSFRLLLGDCSERKMADAASPMSCQVASTPSTAASPMAVSPGVSPDGPATSSARYLLSCTSVCGVEAVESLRAFLPSWRSVVGRSHQAQLFEAALGHDQALFSCVSRSHLEISPSPGRLGAVEVGNLSANAVLIGEERLSQGERRTAQLPADIAFLGNLGAVFLRLRLELRLPAFAVPATSPEASPTPALSPMGRSPSGLGAVGFGMPQQGRLQLELMGSALLPVPLERRRLSVGCETTVGRLRQPELHMQALGDVAAQFVSREHFRVRLADGASWVLELLSSNLAWHVRQGACAELRKGHAPVALASGDNLFLFTGAFDGPGGLGSAGTVYWSFALEPCMH